MCKDCVAAKRRAPTAPFSADLGASPAPNTAAIADLVDGACADAAADAAEILRLLRSLPDAFPATPRLWIPRKIRQQTAAALRALLADAAECADAPSRR